MRLISWPMCCMISSSKSQIISVATCSLSYDNAILLAGKQGNNLHSHCQVSLNKTEKAAIPLSEATAKTGARAFSIFLWTLLLDPQMTAVPATRVVLWPLRAVLSTTAADQIIVCLKNAPTLWCLQLPNLHRRPC
jgi:hypothetical protein